MGRIAGKDIEWQTPDQKCLSVVLTNGPRCSDLLHQKEIWKQQDKHTFMKSVLYLKRKTKMVESSLDVIVNP